MSGSGKNYLERRASLGRIQRQRGESAFEKRKGGPTKNNQELKRVQKR